LLLSDSTLIGVVTNKGRESLMNCCETEKSLPELFGSNVFGDVVQRACLPKNVYKKLRQTIDDGKELDPTIADVVANAIKDWAIERGATHFCHWFQP
jgi:glutamine synthetase